MARTREAQIEELREEIASALDYNTLDEANWIIKEIEEAEQRGYERRQAESADEIRALREALSKVASFCGGHASPECSLGFLTDAVPEEVRLKIEALSKDSTLLDFMNTSRLDVMKTPNGTWEIMSMSGDTAETLGEADTLHSAISAARKASTSV